MNDFIAIDFETANEKRSSVCSVGLVAIRNGKKVGSFYSLIKPTPDYYNPHCQAVHGLGDEDTANEETFEKVWKRVEEWMREMYKDQLGANDRTLQDVVTLVAHNAPFDSSCLCSVFDAYGMGEHGFRFEDTLCAARRAFTDMAHDLETAARACGYELKNHHHALADAEACAEIAIRLL